MNWGLFNIAYYTLIYSNFMWYYYCFVSKWLARAPWARGDCAWREDINQQSNRISKYCSCSRGVTNSYRTEHRCSPQMTCLTRAHTQSRLQRHWDTVLVWARCEWPWRPLSLPHRRRRRHSTQLTQSNIASRQTLVLHFISLTRRHWHQTRHTHKQSNKRDWKVPITINTQ